MDEYIIKQYLDGESAVKIAENLGVTVSKVYWALKRNNIERRSNKQNSRKYSVNDDFFETIDTEEKAYWLGFIYADGYIGTTINTIGIALSSEDIEHLYKFKKSISATYDIKTYVGMCRHGDRVVETEYSRIIFRSDKMRSDLINLGVVPKKTLILEFPNAYQVPNELLSHFIRGYNDGDGSYSANGNGTYSIKICGTFEFLTRLSEILGVSHMSLSKRRNDNKNNYYITIGGQEHVRRISEYLYHNSTIHLDRKFERARMYLQQNSPT